MYNLTVELVHIHGKTPLDHSQSQVEPKPNCQRSNCSGPIIGSHKLKRVSGFEHCSPNANRTKTTPCGKVLNRNQSGVRSINKKQNHHSYTNSLSDNGYYPNIFDYGSFTVNISLGTPQQYYNLIVDTGSPKTWVRCQPCNEGCTSNDPLYDPLKSSCKGNLPMDPFMVKYDDNSFINGIWACDTLAIDDLGSVMNFQFGCGQEIVDGNGDNFVNAAGILGLGKGEFSLASQSGASMQMFSYFVPENDGDADLNFGDKAREKSNTCSNQFTPLVQSYYQEKYYIDLVSISVDGNELRVPWTEFSSGRTIIDSGTVITRLPEEVYSAFRDAFRESMLNYPLLEQVDELMDTCYTLVGIEPIALPEIKFHFGKESTISVTLSDSGIIWPKNNTTSCFAFAATENYMNSIIGIVQQRGFNMLYDLEGERIGFGTDCAPRP
ncbi:unnamed protein product [Withania somnifera]